MEGEDAKSEDARSFGSKSLPRRILIVCAGVLMNFILGLIILIINTARSDAITTTKIASFEDKAMSHQTGLELDDEIIKINGMRIFTAMDMSYQFQNDEDGKYDFVVIRDGKETELKDVAFASDDKTMHVDFRVYPGKLTVGSVLAESFKTFATDGRLIYISLYDMIRGKYSLKDLSGPVGIVDSMNQVVESETDKETGKINWKELLDTMLTLAAFISINIGIFNLLPLPALDGGRLIFLIIEGISGKPVPPEKEGMVHFIGIVALLLLTAIITVSDIMKLF